MREAGYYWVKANHGSQIAYVHGDGTVSLCGTDFSYFESEFHFGPKINEPEALG